MAEITTALLLVSHSARLADGLAELVGQMAPDVMLRAVGGAPGGGLGTDFDRVSAAVAELTAAGEEVVVLSDLGSATLTVETVVEFHDGPRVEIADAPFVEGAVTAGVAAQSGATADVVRRAAEDAATSFATSRVSETDVESPPSDRESPGGAGGGPDDAAERRLELTNQLGLHARSAAMLARVAAGFDATVRVNGVDGTSVLALLALGLGQGDVMAVRAWGTQADDVLEAIAQIVADNFGEE